MIKDNIFNKKTYKILIILNDCLKFIFYKLEFLFYDFLK